MRKIIPIIVLLLGLKAYGITPQIPDKLIYNGKEYEWSGYSPAVKYFKDNNLKAPENALMTTANYGIFIFTYSVVNKRLYLIDVEILTESLAKDGDENEYVEEIVNTSIFKDYFPNQDRILMDFHSNVQLIPYGKMVEVTKNGWTDIHYESYLIFEIDNGIVNTELDLNYEKLKRLKRKQFRKFRKTNKFQKAVLNEKENLSGFNEFRPKKYSMNRYLELIVLRLIKKLN